MFSMPRDMLVFLLLLYLMCASCEVTYSRFGIKRLINGKREQRSVTDSRTQVISSLRSDTLKVQQSRDGWAPYNDAEPSMPSIIFERLDTISNVDDRKQDKQNLDSSFTVQIFSDMDPEIGTSVKIDLAPYGGAYTKEQRVKAADDLGVGENSESVALMWNQEKDIVANFNHSKKLLAELVIVVKKALRYELDTSLENDRREAKHHRSFLADIVAPQYAEESLTVPDLSSEHLNRESLDN